MPPAFLSFWFLIWIFICFECPKISATISKTVQQKSRVSKLRNQQTNFIISIKNNKQTLKNPWNAEWRKYMHWRKLTDVKKSSWRKWPNNWDLGPGTQNTFCGSYFSLDLFCEKNPVYLVNLLHPAEIYAKRVFETKRRANAGTNRLF